MHASVGVMKELQAQVRLHMAGMPQVPWGGLSQRGTAGGPDCAFIGVLLGEKGKQAR